MHSIRDMAILTPYPLPSLSNWKFFKNSGFCWDPLPPFWTMSHILGRGLKAPLTERKCSKIGLAYFTYFCIPLTTEHDVQAKKRRVVAY